MIAADPDRQASLEDLEAYRYVTFSPTQIAAPDGTPIRALDDPVGPIEYTAAEQNWLEGRYDDELTALEAIPPGAPMTPAQVELMDEYIARRAHGTAWALWLALGRPRMRRGPFKVLSDGVRRLWVTASKVQPRRVRWLWDKRIPRNEVSIFAGVQGRGKSVVTMAWIAGVTRGSFGEEPRDALLLSAEEDPETTIVPRLMAAGGDLDRVHIFKIEKQFSIPGDIAVIEEAVAGWDVGLVVIDPLLSFIDDGTDSFKPHAVRRALHALNVVKRTTTIIAVIHFRKESAQEVIHMVTSSSAFTEVPRAALGLGQEPDSSDDEGRLALVHLKANLGPKHKTRLVQIEQSWIDDPDGGEPIDTARAVIGEECDLTKDQVFKPNPGGRKPEVRQQAKEFLIREMAAGGGRVVVRDANKKAVPDLCSKDTLRRAAQDMGLHTEWDAGNEGWIWREPDEWRAVIRGQSGR